LNECRDSRIIPALDSNDIELSLEAFRMFLQRQKQAHLGLLDKEAKPQRSSFPNGHEGNEKYKEEKQDHKERVELWERRQCEAFSFLYEACNCDPAITLVMRNYIKKCENHDPPQEKMASELITLILDRFTEQKRHKLKAVKQEYNDFKADIGEDLKTAMGRLSTIILELTELNEAPTDEANRLALTSGLENGDDSLEILSCQLAMQPTTTTFEGLQTLVNNYQDFQESRERKKRKIDKVIAANHLQTAEMNMETHNIEKKEQAVEFCDHCHVRGHTEEVCRKKIRDRQWYAKNGGKGKGRGRGYYAGRRFSGRGHGGKGSKGGKGEVTGKDDGDDSTYGPGDDEWTKGTEFAGKCFSCDKYGHKAFECKEKPLNKQLKWEASMIITRKYTNAPEVNMMENQEVSTRVYLDSCCSHGSVIVNEAMLAHMTNLTLTPYKNDEESAIQLSERGKTMTVSHVGDLGAFTGVMVAPNIRKNLCGILRLNLMGYNFTMNSAKSEDQGQPTSWITHGETDVKIFQCSMDPVVGLPWLELTDFLKLTDTQDSMCVDMLERMDNLPNGDLVAVTTPMVLTTKTAEEQVEIDNHRAYALKQGRDHSKRNSYSSDEEYTASEGRFMFMDDGTQVYHTREQVVAREAVLAQRNQTENAASGLEESMIDQDYDNPDY
jgi:hypothetical protein